MVLPTIRMMSLAAGKKLGRYEIRSKAKPPWKVVIIPFAGGQPVKLIDVPPGVNFRAGLWWTDDARAFFYANVQDGVANLWSQPVDGGKPVQITNFNSGFIASLALSRD